MSNRAWVSLGWWGYFTCAVIYMISGLRAGDWLGLSGSFFFFAATVAFLIPHYRNSSGERPEREGER